MGAKGSPKTGGRKKGTPNKRTQEFIEVLERRNFSPADALIDVYRKAIKAFRDNAGASSGDGPDMTFKYLEIAQKASAELMQYLYPKRKPIDAVPESDPNVKKPDIKWVVKKGGIEKEVPPSEISKELSDEYDT